MKKITLCLMLVLTLIMPSIAFAEEPPMVAAVEGIQYATLKEAVAKAEEIGVKQITLINNVVLDESVEISKEIELDLNGYTITPSSTMTDDSLIIVLHGGTLTVGDYSVEKTGKISANNSTTYVGIKMTKAGGDTTKKATLIVDCGIIEGYYYGISGNGNPDRINTDITVRGGTIKGLNGAGIYQPQVGKLTVIDGHIEGLTGIEIRAGELKVEGGTIKGTNNGLVSNKNGNGITTKGAGISVAQHTTKKDIDVNITGGNIQGYTALHQSNIQENSAEDIAKVSLLVEGGSFEAINGGTQAVYSENKTNFIKDGTFSSDVTGYVSNNIEIEKDENGDYITVTKYNINVITPQNGTITLDKTKAKEGETVVITATAADGYIVRSIGVSYTDTSYEGYDETFEFMMPNEDVKVTAVFEKIKENITIEAEVPSEIENAERIEEEIIKKLKDVLAKGEESIIKNRNLVAELIIDEWDNTEEHEEINHFNEYFKDVIEQEELNLNNTKRFMQAFINVKDKDTKENLMPLELKLEQPIKLNASLSEALLEGLPKVADGFEREFYIIRRIEIEHSFIYDILEAELSEDEKNLEFSTDKTGLFNIAYRDVKEEVAPPTGEGETGKGEEIKPEDKPITGGVGESEKEPEEKPTTPDVPKTGDNVVAFAVIAVVAIVGLAVTIKMRKK